MPFPFIPFGAMMAMLVLGGTFVLFFTAVNKICGTIGDVGGAVVGQLVSGFDDWSHEHGDDQGPGDHDGRDRIVGDPMIVDSTDPVPTVRVEPTRAIRQ